MTVYLTNTEYTTSPGSEKRPDPKLEWEARITNLSGFSEPRTVLEEYGISPLWEQWIVIFLVGWAVPFTIAVALLFQALYLRFLVRLQLLGQWGWRSIVLILCTSLIGFPAAECIATYIFRDPFTIIFGVDHWLNLPTIVLNATLLTCLWWKVWRATERAAVHAG